LSEGNNLKSCGNFKKMKLQYRHKWMTSIKIWSYVNRSSCRPQEFLLISLLTSVASDTDRFYLVDRNIHGTCTSINYMKKQKHTNHTLIIYFWKNNVQSVKAPDGLNASWRNGCPGDNSSLYTVANEAFHYWRVEVETMICEVVICA
jgi:hypothetical protein